MRKEFMLGMSHNRELKLTSQVVRLTRIVCFDFKKITLIVSISIKPLKLFGKTVKSSENFL